MRFFIIMICGLLLAACGSSNGSTPDGTPISTSMPLQGPEGRSLTPIPAAPDWIKAAEVITRENVSEARLLGRLDVRGTPSTLFSHSFSPDGTGLAALNNEQMLAWDLITGERTLETSREGASFIHYAPDKTELYTIDPEGLVQVFNAENGRYQNDFLGHADFSNANVFADNDGWLALGGLDGVVRVWDSFERRALATINAHPRTVTALAFSSDGTLLATASESEVKVWRWQERELIATLDQNEAIVRRLAFSPDGARLAVGTTSYVALWQISDALFLYALQPGAGGANDVLMYSPDGRFLITGGAVPDMIVWDAVTGDLVALLPGLGGDVTSAAFSPAGDLLLAAVLDGAVTLWDMTNITDETVVRAELEVGTERVLDVAFSPDGFSMLFFDAIGPVYVWGIPAA